MKKIGVFYADLGNKEIETAALLMIASVKEVMPDAHFVQFTNMTSPVLPYMSEVVRKEPQQLGFMEARIDHFASYPHEQMLFLDPDIIMQKDVWDVFDTKFDVALTDRGGKPVMMGDKDISIAMPHNTGVMFSVGNAFWRRVSVEMKKMSRDDKDWFGDQIAVGRVVKAKIFDVKVLDGSMYNYTPLSKEEDVSEKYIVHYKGKRKAWMSTEKKELA